MGFEENNDENLRDVPFETALDKAGFGLYSWLLTALTGLSIIGFSCIIYSSTIIVPTSQCELNSTLTQQSFLVATPIIASTLGLIIWGYLADRHGRRKMLLVSFCSATIGNCIASISSNWIMLIVLQFITAVLAAGQYSISMTLLSECVPMVRRNVVVMIVASIFLLSQGVMALLAIPIIPLEFSHYLPALGIYWNSWRTTLLVYGMPSVVCFIWMYFMQESPKYVFVKHGEDEALKILRTIHRINHRNGMEELQVKGLLPETNTATDNGSSNSNIRQLFTGRLLKYFIIVATLSMFEQTGAFMIWLPTIANEFVEVVNGNGQTNMNLCGLLKQGNENADTSSCSLNVTSLLLVFAVGVLQSVFNFVLSLVVNKTGRRNLVIVITLVSGISGIIVNLIPNAFGSAVFFVIFLQGMLLIGLYTAISVALFPTHLRALAVSLTMVGGRVMLFVSAPVLNVLINGNCDAGFYIFASLIVASALVVSFLPDDRFITKTQSKEVLQDSNEVER